MEIEIRHNGADIKAEVQVLKGAVWVHYNGRTFVEQIQTAGRKSRKAVAGAASDEVLAPMPGKVTKILVNLGQEIEKGQAVLVMEAMKMEYTLKAEVTGTVLIIQCQLGDQVALGKMLVKVESVKS